MIHAGKWMRRGAPFKRASFIVALYVVIAGLWLTFSDQALAYFIDDPQEMARAQTFKGLFFVLATGALLFVLVYRAAHGMVRDHRIALQAARDELTGLPGQAMIDQWGPRLLDRAHTKGQPAAVLIIDIVQLNRVNEALGVAAGNAVLLEVTRRLQKQRDAGVTVARPGADEFVLLVGPPCTADQAESVARQVTTDLNQPFRFADEPLDINVSVGVALYPRDGRDIHELMHAADSAQRSARSKGCQISFFAGQEHHARRLLSLETDLKRALDKEQFRVYYQPKVDLVSGKLLGAEALLRWEHPEKGMISPGTFIPLLEDSGGIEEVGAWVLQQAAQDMKHWSWQDSQPPNVCVNVSRMQLDSPEFARLGRQIMGQLEPATPVSLT